MNSVEAVALALGISETDLRRAIWDHAGGTIKLDYCRCEKCTRSRRSRVRRQAARVQAETASRATRNHYQWTGPELEVASRGDLTGREVALRLGRSYASVKYIRRRLRDDATLREIAGVTQSVAEMPEGRA